MRKLIALSVIVFIFVGATSTTQASTGSESKQLRMLVKAQQQRYYHALGYYKAIWNVSSRTVYSPNFVTRLKWQRASLYLLKVQKNAKHEIEVLTTPPTIYLDASDPAENYRVIEPIIRKVFGAYGSQALSVTGCETGYKYNTNAENGQYKDLFQMGDHERATYGDARDVLGATQAAYRYFVASGKDWSPWECKP